MTAVYADLLHVESVIYVDGRTVGERLLEGDDADAAIGWDGCDYRLTSRHYAEGVPCNVTVTGKAPQRRHGGQCLRVRIEWVRHGEPSETCGGWLWVSE